MKRSLVLGAVLFALCGLDASSVRQPRPCGLLIITLDTTRADRLPAYGFASVATPALDRVVREGVVFDHAESVAPLTLPAHTSLFTGLYPPRHGVRDNLAPPLDPTHTTLAEILHARGFRTAAFVGSIVLAPDRGLARGFEVYNDGARAGSRAPRRRSANEIIDDASTWIAHLDAVPFFLWVHLYDAHAPQTLPLEFRRTYGDSYDGAIAYMDSQIGRLFDALRQKGLLGRTAVIIAGDHGESLGEHGEREHGIFVYEGATHVPLVIRTPAVAPRRIPTVTSLVDVVPTILDVFGIAAYGALDGRSLAPAFRGMPLSECEVYAESMYAKHFGWSPLRMIRYEDLKYIDAPRPEMYDLRSDPFEQRDLSAKRPVLAAAMRARLARIETPAAAQPARSVSVTADTSDRLAALGYISSGVATTAASTESGRDPKDYIQVFNEIRGRARQ